MKKLIITTLLGLVLINSMINAQEVQEPVPNFADVLFLITANTILHFGLAVGHELGHIALAKLFVALGVPLVSDNLPLPHHSNTNEPSSPVYLPNDVSTSLESKTTLTVTAGYPEFKNKWANALVILAGPAAGAFTSYVLLKATNIIIELNKENSTLKAIKTGLKKPAFNEEQPQSIQGLAFAHMLLNGFALFPYQANQGAFLSEGEKIRQYCFKRNQ